MENNKASLTALVSGFARGYHAVHSKEPIINDRMVYSLLKEEEKRAIATNWANACSFFNKDQSKTFKNMNEKLEWVMNTQCVPQLVSRAKYVEEQLLLAIQRGVKQYMILGAGLDTFAFRQGTLPKDFIIYEVDHPFTQALKRNRIQEMGLEIPDNVKFVPVDFTKDSLHDEIKKVGFDEQKLSFFSLLGVVMYLNKNVFYHLLSLVSDMSPNGSSFIFDYLDDTAFNNELASQKMIQMRQITAQAGEPIITGFDPFDLDVELQDYKMLVYENLSPQNIEERYFKNREDELHAFDHFHFAHLVVNK